MWQSYICKKFLFEFQKLSKSIRDRWIHLLEKGRISKTNLTQSKPFQRFFVLKNFTKNQEWNTLLIWEDRRFLISNRTNMTCSTFLTLLKESPTVSFYNWLPPHSWVKFQRHLSAKSKMEITHLSLVRFARNVLTILENKIHISEQNNLNRFFIICDVWTILCPPVVSDKVVLLCNHHFFRGKGRTLELLVWKFTRIGRIFPRKGTVKKYFIQDAAYLLTKSHSLFKH